MTRSASWLILGSLLLVVLAGAALFTPYLRTQVAPPPENSVAACQTHDINHNGRVDSNDEQAFRAYLSSTAPKICTGLPATDACHTYDINSDGKVSAGDLSLLRAYINDPTSFKECPITTPQPNQVADLTLRENGPESVEANNQLTYTYLIKNFTALTARGLAVEVAKRNAAEFIKAEIVGVTHDSTPVPCSGKAETNDAGQTVTAKCGPFDLTAGSVATMKVTVKSRPICDANIETATATIVTAQSPALNTQGVAVAFRTYVNDQPAPPNGANGAERLSVGDTFRLKIATQDIRTPAIGLHSAYVNVTWDPTVFALNNENAGLQPFNINQLITAKLPLFRSGTLDQAAGTIKNLGGSVDLLGSAYSSVFGQLVGRTDEEPVAELHFKVLQPAFGSPLEVSVGENSSLKAETEILNIGEQDSGPWVTTQVLCSATTPSLPPSPSASPTPSPIGPETPAPNQAPAAPSNFQGTVIGPGSVRWTWTDNSNNEDGFYYRTHTGQLGSTRPANSESMTQNNLAPPGTYVRTLEAFNAYGTSARVTATVDMPAFSTPTPSPVAFETPAPLPPPSVQP